MRTRKTFYILFMLPLMLFAAFDGNAQNKFVSVDFKNTPLGQALEQIEAQSGYHFLYNSALLDASKPVSLKKTNADIREVLDEMLRDFQVKYKIVDNQIILSTLDAESPEHTGAAAGNNPKPAGPISPTSSGSRQSEREQQKKQIRIEGIVTSVEDGLPLEFVTVLVKGGNIHAITDAAGRYQLNVENTSSLSLVFHYIGYETIEEPVGGRGVINVGLKPEINILKDVVVTGYTTISKERATGAFNIVEAEQLEKPAVNIASRLVGTTAGLAAVLDAEGNPTFEIRGKTSLFADAQPLLVVDGFAVEGGFSSINPNDVASVTILKDAAAASIWGARSANGVIVVTTKKPQKGDALKVEFNSFAKVGSKLDLDYVNPLASSAETIEYEQMAHNHWGATINNGDLFDNYWNVWSQGLNAINEHYYGYINDNERDAILERLRNSNNKQQISDHLLAVPVSQQYNLTISSAANRSTHIFSMMFADNQTNFKKVKNQQYMMNYRASVNLFKWLDFNFSGMFRYTTNNNSGYDLSYVKGLSPYDMLVNPDGSYANVIDSYYWPAIEREVPMEAFPYPDWTFNPIREMNNRDIRSTGLNARIQAGLTFKLLKGLTYDAKIQYEISNTYQRNLFGEETSYVRNLVNTNSTWDGESASVERNFPMGSILEQGRDELTGYNFRNQLNFNRIFGQHDISFVAGSEVSDRTVQGITYAPTYGYNDETLTVESFPNGSDFTDWMGYASWYEIANRFSYATDRYFSLYANLSYTFNQKYTVSGSARTDASNLITDDPAYRYSPFWSVGLGWQLSKERFMQSIEWLDRLALRLTYGINGNVDKSTAFAPLIALDPQTDPYTHEYTAWISSYGNPTLRWEKVGTFNIGIDYSLFSGKLYGNINLYNKKGTDLIANISIPSVNGTTNQKFNNGAMTNRGIEIELGSSLNILDRRIRWAGNLNFAYNHNEITKFYKANYQPSNLIFGGTAAYVQGKDANTLWVYKYAGVYNMGTESSPNMQPTVWGPNEETRYDLSKSLPGDARSYLHDMGTKVAPYVLGFSNQFKIFDFDLSFVITGKFGHVFKHHSFNYPRVQGSKLLPNARLSEVLHGDPMEIVPLPYNSDEPRFSNWITFVSHLDYLVDNASHVRLQEVNLTYHIPVSFCTKIGLSRMQLYAQGNNLLVLTANKYNEDPEFPLGTVRPRPAYTFGLKIDF